MEEKEPFVILPLDKPRKFRMTLRAIKEFTLATGLSLEDPEVLANAIVNDIDVLTQLIACGTRKWEPDITPEIVEEEIDINNLVLIVEQVYAHMGIKILKPGEKKNSPRATIPRKRASGRGKPPAKQPSASG